MSKRTPHNHISQAPKRVIYHCGFKIFQIVVHASATFLSLSGRSGVLNVYLHIEEVITEQVSGGLFLWNFYECELFLFLFVNILNNPHAFDFSQHFTFLTPKTEEYFLFFSFDIFFLASILFFSFVFVMMLLLLGMGVGGYLLICFFCFVPCTWSH